ncbi:sulfite exporter TauE/SafE family protein [Alkalibacillus aidingensis]|uniref:sulfite exporter TauE/SafE family protein n=1 Tax=Alkalibacillus aidingensis TaxID=2747607 RepID=UPI0016610195|nr:sulfite exporter TauE/SafE family protein [Alkalibacillus aidingensis]
MLDLIILFFVGLTATTLGTLAGGGGLISLPAMLTLGIPVHSAIGANKVTNSISSFTSFLMVYRQKGVTIKEGLKIIPISLGGGVAGGIIASSLPPDLMYKIAIGLLIFAFLFSFISKADFSGKSTFHFKTRGTPFLFGIGIYDGMFGPGQGTLMLYVFSYLKISYYRAVGLMRVATFASCFGAAISFISAGHIIWSLTFALIVGSLLGAQVGVRLAGKLKPHHVKILLRAVTAALILYILFDNLVI